MSNCVDLLLRVACDGTDTRDEVSAYTCVLTPEMFLTVNHVLKEDWNNKENDLKKPSSKRRRFFCNSVSSKSTKVLLTETQKIRLFLGLFFFKSFKST